MEDFIILIDLKISVDSVEISCYSGDFNAHYDDEDSNCRRYVFACEENQIKEINQDTYRESSSVHINTKQNRVYLQNDWSLAEDAFLFVSFQVFQDSTGKILSEKIKHIRSCLENERLSTRNKDGRLQEISKLVSKEIDVDQRKVAFFQAEKRREQLAGTLARIEFAERISAILERKDT